MISALQYELLDCKILRNLPSRHEHLAPGPMLQFHITPRLLAGLASQRRGGWFDKGLLDVNIVDILGGLEGKARDS